MSLVQIVPRLPPSVDGLGDYALNLARQFRKSFGIESRFIVGDPDWIGGREIEGFATTRLTSRSPGALAFDLLASVPPEAVVLHYVGYGYAKRGAPAWLIPGLEVWRSNQCSAPLLTMFHEVYASGPFWRSSFWTSSRQKQIAARLAGLSDACLTSRENYADILRGLNRENHRSITTIPVFSSIGEPKETPRLLADRTRRLVVFGAVGSRRRVYEKSLSFLERVCQAFSIQEIVDIGPPLDYPIVSQINDVPIVQTGSIPAGEVSAILSDSIVGYFDYSRAFLAKSTVFAAFCAHGLIVVSAPYENSSADQDGLETGKHYLVADLLAKGFDLARGQRIADNAYAWYAGHDLSVHARAYFAHLKASVETGALLSISRAQS